jgi:NAD(P)-binding Rossmann-like domain
MQQTVAVFGGGVAGLSAAHELAERGFQVHVYERKSVLGGKARSIPVPNSGANGRLPLPGEHGFRFFPGFYKHVTDTMRRTPYGAHGNVFDNLSVATRMLLARAGQTEIAWISRRPRTLEDLRAFLLELLTPLGVPLEELKFFFSRLLMFATSCADPCLARRCLCGAPRESRPEQLEYEPERLGGSSRAHTQLSLVSCLKIRQENYHTWKNPISIHGCTGSQIVLVWFSNSPIEDLCQSDLHSLRLSRTQGTTEEINRVNPISKGGLRAVFSTGALP